MRSSSYSSLVIYHEHKPKWYETFKVINFCTHLLIHTIRNELIWFSFSRWNYGSFLHLWRFSYIYYFNRINLTISGEPSRPNDGNGWCCPLGRHANVPRSIPIPTPQQQRVQGLCDRLVSSARCSLVSTGSTPNWMTIVNNLHKTTCLAHKNDVGHFCGGSLSTYKLVVMFYF